MKIVYIVSRYPQLSETFIAREMAQISKLGHEVFICPMKGVSPQSKKGLVITQAHLIPQTFIVLNALLGLLWAIRTRPKQLLSIINNIFYAKIFSVNFLKLWGIFFLTLSFARRIENMKFQHIRAHFLHTEAVSAMWLSTLLGIPYSITVHTSVILYPRELIREVIQKAEFRVGDSQETVQLLSDFLGNSDKVYLIRNGVNLKELFINAEYKTKTSFIIVAVGRLVKKKGFDVLIKACSLLKKEGLDFICKIIGEGDEHKKLSNLISKYGLEKYIILPGSLPFEELIKIYREASVLAVPSCIPVDEIDVDGIPTVIIEAMAMRVPVIASSVGGIPDIVLNNETGLLVEPGNENALMNALCTIYDNRKLVKKLTQNAFELVEREYDIESSCNYLEKCILQNSQSID